MVQLGKDYQTRVPSSQLSAYIEVHRDPVKAIHLTESNMIKELLPMRHERMLQNPFTFYRGTAELMEQDLKRQHQSKIPIIICGDAHVNNFGFYASPERQLLFGLNDFDEARIGNWESDLKRLLVSVVLAGNENNYDHDAIYQLLQTITKTYRHAIKQAVKEPILQRFYYSFRYNDMVNLIQTMADDHSTKQVHKIMNKILKKSQQSNSAKIVRKMCHKDATGKMIFTDNPPRAKHISTKRYHELVDGFVNYRKHAREDIKVLLANYHINDIIRYSVGVGSFGTRCYLILLKCIDGSFLVLQVKETLPLRYNLQRLAVREAIQNGSRAGRRIVTAQKTLQSSSDPFLGPTSFAGRSYYVRQFRDMKESINVTKLDFESFTLYCETCALLLAVAHSQSPTAPLIRGYLKHQKALDHGLADWSVQYAHQVKKDYELCKDHLY